MIILIKKDADQSQVDNLVNLLKTKNITPKISVGSMHTVIGCVGDVAHIVCFSRFKVTRKSVAAANLSPQSLASGLRRCFHCLVST